MSELAELRALLESSDSSIKQHCKELLEAGVSHREIARVTLGWIADCAAADASWLPAASFVNLSDSLVQVEFQEESVRYKLLQFGERAPDFRRITPPSPEVGSTSELHGRFCSAVDGHDVELGERCLLGIDRNEGLSAVLKLVVGTLLEPKFLGVVSGPWWSGLRHLSLANVVHLWREFGDDVLRGAICSFGARQCCRKFELPDAEPQRSQRQRAVRLLEDLLPQLGYREEPDAPWDEALFRESLRTCDVARIFPAILESVQRLETLDQLALAMTMHCVERLVRGGYGEIANWDNLKRELLSVAAIRHLGLLDASLAAKAAFHAGWQFARHGDVGLASDIPMLMAHPIPDQDEQADYVLDAMGGSNSKLAIQQVHNYIAGGHDREELLRRMILWANEHCLGNGYYAGQRAIIDAWRLAKNHPERNRIPQALAGWVADYRNQHRKHRRDYGPIWGANLSADGALLAIRSNGTRVFDTASGDELMWFRGHPWRFAFHPNSRWLAAGWEGGRLQIIDLVSRRVIHQCEAFPDDVSGQFGDGKFWGLEFSPDGALLAGASRGCCEVRVWDTATWELKYELLGHTRPRNEAVTFTADSQFLASGGNDGTVRFWHAGDGMPHSVFDRFEDASGRISGLQFHPDGERIVGAECDGEIICWEWQTGSVLWKTLNPGYCNFAGFTADGRRVVTEHDGDLHFWETETGSPTREPLHTIPRQPDDHTIFGGVNPSRDRCLLVTAGWHGLVKVWKMDDLSEVMSIQLDLG